MKWQDLRSSDALSCLSSSIFHFLQKKLLYRHTPKYLQSKSSSELTLGLIFTDLWTWLQSAASYRNWFAKVTVFLSPLSEYSSKTRSSFTWTFFWAPNFFSSSLYLLSSSTVSTFWRQDDRLALFMLTQSPYPVTVLRANWIYSSLFAYLNHLKTTLAFIKNKK